MAFTIRIYEKNGYIYSLLKKRLSCFYPDAYIVDPYLDEQDYEDRFSDYTRVLYDPADINADDISSDMSSPIRLTEDGGIIDCARLISMLKPTEDAPSFTRPVTGSLSAVIPFVYSDVRDGFIRYLASRSHNTDFNIRLDFTSKLRSLWHGRSGCNMTSLLEACRSRKFVPEDILKYCNMDDSGFLTPGCTTNYDDVNDLGTARSVTLMHHAADLAHSDRRTVNILAVIEGFRMKDLAELLACCDMVYILLPAKNAAEDIGSKDMISMLTKTLGRERIAVYYADELTGQEYHGNSLIRRRLVV